MTQKSISPRAWALLFVLALLWGGSFLSNRLALEEIGVFTTVAMRVAGASVLLWLWVFLRRLPVPREPRLVAVFLIMGLLNNAMPFSLIVWGQQYIESGLASILNAATANLAALLVPIFFADERLTLRKALGVGFGFLGVVSAIGIEHLRDVSLTSLGQLAILGASLCYAVSTIFARFALRGLRPEVSAAGMLTASSLIMVPFALWAEGLPSLQYSTVTWGAVIYLAAMSSALAYILYYVVMSLAGASNLSLVTLLVAPVAIVLGALVYGEALPLRAYIGFAILATGLLIIDGRIERRLRQANAS